MWKSIVGFYANIQIVYGADFLSMCHTDFEATFFIPIIYTHDLLLLIILPHEIHINFHITIMAIMKLLPQPPGA
jgi:hypothetical protein